MSDQAIRTWTLDWQAGPARVSGPKELEGAKYVRVTELEPVLDLLAEWFESRPLRRMDNVDGKALDKRTVAFLRENGRHV